MKQPLPLESPTPASPRTHESRVLRLFVVSGDTAGGAALVQGLKQWADDAALEVECVPDLPRAVRQLGAARWDVVLAVLGERPDDDLAWWVEALRGAAGGPRLIAAANRPSMGLVLRAEKLGVLDLLALPVRKDDVLRALRRVRSAEEE